MILHISKYCADMVDYLLCGSGDTSVKFYISRLGVGEKFIKLGTLFGKASMEVIMKRILCFGDSNTWGSDPTTFNQDYDYFVRYDENTRWTALLQKKLGSDYCIIEEGLGGRTTVLDDPITSQQLNGKKYLMPCLGSHAPIDLVILMLGTNDLKSYFSMTAYSISMGIDLLVKMIKSSNYGISGKSPDMLIISPVTLDERLNDSCLKDLFDVPYTIERCKILPELIENVAKDNGCKFLKCDDYIELSTIDYIHFTKTGHAKLAEQLYKTISSIKL